MRPCSRSGCYAEAVATLTYVYADATAVIGPLAAQDSPHAYDLCARHTQSFTAPRGWQVVRLATQFSPPEPSTDDLDALAQAIRVASRHPRPAEQARPDQPQVERPHRSSHATHLRVVSDNATPESSA
ncbi:DUF3499 domain-containing protein [Nanchangia anserum]|nr:DUF3499 domain-containing protein [Nanchangia anserum]